MTKSSAFQTQGRHARQNPVKRLILAVAVTALLTCNILPVLALDAAHMGPVTSPLAQAAEPEAATETLEESWSMAAANPQRTSWNAEEVRGLLHPVWYRPIEPYISPKTQVIASNDRLYISTARGLYAFHTGTGAVGREGELAWVYPTALPLGHSPTIHNGVAYVGGFDHKIHAVDALTGEGLWTFEAGAGFQTNPLVVNGMVIAGNRDGSMYAIYDNEQALAGTLAWKYKTGGPILFSAAHQDNTIYFASGDARAYALNAANGSLVWRSDKLPGPGFYSWWPVVYENVVILAGGHNYRTRLEPYKESDLQGLEREDLYPGWQDLPADQLLGTRDSESPYAVDASPILKYFEDKPWRRTTFVLDRQTGKEVTHDLDGDGKPEYAPITWFGTHGAGSRFPPVIGADGLLYQSMSYVQTVDSPIARGHIVGWEPGAGSFTTPSAMSNAMDEPIAYSAGGNLLYWSRHRDCAAGSIDYSIPNPNRDTGFGSSPGRQWNYWSRCLELRDEIIPGYITMFQILSDYPSVALYRGETNSVNGVYERHGDQNPPIPYKGRVYIHRSNTLIALADFSGEPAVLPAAATVEAQEPEITPVPTIDLKATLSTEIQKILDAGHLRPGYLSHGLFDQRTELMVGENLVDYWHHPGDTLVALLRSLPHLPAGQQTAVRTYLQNEYANYPPGTTVHIGWRDGAAREAYLLPPEVEADRVNHPPHSNYASFYAGWHYPPDMFYALWKYAAEFGNARGIFDASKGRLQAPPADEYLVQYPYVHNAYIAGYLGYLELERLAGYATSANVQRELDRLLSLRVTTLDKDNPWQACERPDCDEYNRALNVARNFMSLVPEVAEVLRDSALPRIEAAVAEYSAVAPFWFVTKTENAYGEGIVNPLFDSHALFQARALILRESRRELLKYLDVPAFERGDLFYIEKLVLLLEAQGGIEKTVSPFRATQGDTVAYALAFYGSGDTLSVVDTLPPGTSAPFDFALEGTEIAPSYDGSRHRLTWTGAPPAGQRVIVRYRLEIVTGESDVLINSVALAEPGREPSTDSASVLANMHSVYVPVALRRE